MLLGPHVPDARRRITTSSHKYIKGRVKAEGVARVQWREGVRTRDQDNAIRLVVNFLPSHTAICKVYGTMRSERMVVMVSASGNRLTTYRSLPCMRTFQPWSSALRK